jgi:hypothetical protein
MLTLHVSNFRPRLLIRLSLASSVVLFLVFSLPVDAKPVDVDVTGSAQMAYDDNVTLANANEKKDFVSSLNIGLQLNQEGKTHAMSLDANITQQVYGRHGEFNNLSEEVDFNLTKELSKYDRVRFDEVFSHAEEPSSFEDAFGRTSGRYSRIKNRAGLEYEHDYSRQVSARGFYYHTGTYLSRGDLRDSNQHRAGGKAIYSYDTSTILNTRYEFIKQIFEGGADSTINSVSVGVKRFLTTQSFVDLAIGPDFIESFSGEHHVKPNLVTGVTVQPDENTSARFSFRKHYTTTSTTQDLFNSWRLALDLFRKITDQIDVVLNVFYGEGTFVDLGITETLSGARTGLDYSVTDNVTTGVGYSFTSLESDNAGNEYQKNLVYFKVSVTF